MIIVIHGVSGSGKSTIGRLLADKLGWSFLDADDFHPPKNKQLMRKGVPLTEEDRLPWLLSLQEAIRKQRAEPGNAVFAISALKKSHRALLRGDTRDVQFVFLDVDEATARGRLESRRGHFFNPQLLQSQFAALERPDGSIEDSLTVDASQSPVQIVDAIAAAVRSRSRDPAKR